MKNNINSSISLFIIPDSHPTVQEADLDLFIEEIVASRERGIIASSKKIEEVTWNLPTSIYFVVTVITTIGK